MHIINSKIIPADNITHKTAEKTFIAIHNSFLQNNHVYGTTFSGGTVYTFLNNSIRREIRVLITAIRKATILI